MRRLSIVASAVWLSLVGPGALCQGSDAGAPWATRVDFAAFREFGTIVIPNGPAPVEKRLDFPAVPERRDRVPVLRFQARLDAPEPGGWNYYLELALNGRRLTALTANGTPRLLNRDLETQAFINNRLTALPYWGSSGERTHPC